MIPDKLGSAVFFFNAKKMVGLHGAGFANIVFCKPNTKILELQSNTAGDIIKKGSVVLVKKQDGSEVRKTKINRKGEFKLKKIHLIKKRKKVIALF